MDHHPFEIAPNNTNQNQKCKLFCGFHAASLAAVRGADELVEPLASSNRKMAAAIRDQGIAVTQEANREVHHALTDACGAPRLRKILGTRIDMPVIARSFLLSEPAELEQSLHHHENLTVAASARDGEMAKHAMQLHLRMSFQRFMRHRSECRAANHT